MRPDRFWVCAPTYAVNGARCRGSRNSIHEVHLGVRRGREHRGQEYSSCTALIARARMSTVAGSPGVVSIKPVEAERVDILLRTIGSMTYHGTICRLRWTSTRANTSSSYDVRCGRAHPTVRQRTDRSIAQEHAKSVDLRRRMMGIDAVKDGWQRFLDRLKRLWGKPRDGETLKA